MSNSLVKIAENSVTLPLSWYDYNQNNTGGSFIGNDRVGRNVYIQATSAYEANSKAEDLGIYFDGCEDSIDCPCCGDRWYRSYQGEEEFPKAYEYTKTGFTKCEYALSDDLISGSVYAVFYFYDGSRHYGVAQVEE